MSLFAASTPTRYKKCYRTLPQRLHLYCMSGQLTTIFIYPPDWPPGNETLGWVLCLGRCSWCHLLSGWQKVTSARWGDHVSLLFLLSVHIRYTEHASQLNFKQNVQKGILGEWGSCKTGKKSPTSCTVIAARYRHRLLCDWVIKRQKWRHEPNGKRFQCREESLYSLNGGSRRNPPNVLLDNSSRMEGACLD